MNERSERCTVYCIRHKETGREYIGITSRHVERRWCQHRSAARKGSSSVIARAIAKYGSEAFDWIVLEVVESRTLAGETERALIAERKPVFNLSLGGEGSGKHSPETRQKLSQANKGRKHTEQSRLNMSLAHRGSPGCLLGLTECQMLERRLKQRLAYYHRSKTTPKNRSEAVRQGHRIRRLKKAIRAFETDVTNAP